MPGILESAPLIQLPLSPAVLTKAGAIAGIYETVEPCDVLVHAGAEEAIFTLMHALLEPDDHVIVHWPQLPIIG
jgi:aspartate/methionine/tyrosine aminotransferase